MLTPLSADWGAGHSTLSSAVNGTDYIGWAGATQHLFGEALAGYVDNGTVPIEIVDDKIIRCVAVSATSPSSCTC
jgi:beta-glucosidase